VLLIHPVARLLHAADSTAIGIRCKDGVVLGCEKSVQSKMLVQTSNRRIHTLDLHAGLALSGLAADARQLVNKARSEASEYRSFYGSEIPGKVLSDRLASANNQQACT
jgi:20S proteasome subunit alpha 7